MLDPSFSNSVLITETGCLHPGLSVDCIIFGFHEGTLKVLLNKFMSYTKWMLPGGFILKEESVDAAAYRVLKSRTNLDNVYLRQFYLFGDRSRTDYDENEDVLIRAGFEDASERKNHWLLQRFATVGYYALVEYSKVKIQTNSDEEIAWFDLDKIPTLYSDHNKVIDKALSIIKINLSSLPIGYELLPEKFTMADLRIIYETILDKKLDRRNFQRMMLSSGLVYKLDEMAKKFGVKSSTLFSFNKEKYEKALVGGYLVSN